MPTLDRLRTKVAEIIADKGKAATYRKIAKSYSRTTGETTETATDYTVKMTPPESDDRRFARSTIEGTLVEAGDVFVSLADSAIEFVPEVGDKVIFDSETWTVVQIIKTYSGELIATWDLQVRK